MKTSALPVPRYREITAADMSALFHVRTRTRENAYTLEQLHRLGITPASVIQKLSNSFSGWLCEVCDEVVGFCMVDRSSGELWVIAVLPQFEGRGIGRQLMRLAEDGLWASGCTRAWLTTDVDTTLRAYGFYRHRGWTDWKVEDGLRWMERLPAVGDAGDDERDAVMECELVASSPDGQTWPLALRIDAPSRSKPADWQARVEVGGLLPQPVRVHGVDSWQAVQLAIQLATDILAAFETRGGVLMWPGPSGEPAEHIVRVEELLPRHSR